MEILSQQFAILTLTALVVYHLLPRRGQNIWLLACSLYFAASWKQSYALVLLLSIFTNYCFGLLINNKTRSAKSWLALGVILNAGGWLFFRFAEHDLFEVFFRYLSGGLPLSTRILIPVGFSFYTLQAISYLVDVYKKQIPPEKDLIDFGVFLAYFPRLLSGPIERGKSLLPQLKNPRLVDNDLLAEGSWLIILGLFRKLVLASLLFALIPEGIFTRPMDFSVTDRWIAILVYSFWLYNDFAGYTAIVRGISLFFGIRLFLNFRQPFFSRTFLEFWNRWHISLSFWLRDYIFFPIQRALLQRGYASRSLLRTILPPLVTMTVSGLWHNATVALFAWGITHGGYQIIDHITSLKPGYTQPKDRPFWQQILLAVKVYILLLPTWILFAAGGLKIAINFAASLFAGSGVTRIRPIELIIPAIGLFISFLLDYMQERSNNEEKGLFQLPKIAQSLCIAFSIFCILLSLLWSSTPSAAFVYQSF